ncbi:MAG: hypothetical protein QOJ67_2661 [Acidimicrobiaceae bacterium]
MNNGSPTLTDTSRPAARSLDVVVAVALAGMSGAALMAHGFLDIPLSFTAPFVVLPTTAAAAILVFVRQGIPGRAAVITERVIAGGLWGLIATAAYDVIRPPLLWVLHLHFSPFRAMPVFGSLITGRPTTDGVAIAVGWGYHVWNGVTFGMMLCLARPQSRWVAGMVWGLFLQISMMTLYPDLLQVRLDNPGFLVSSIVGHAVWGFVLGTGLHWRATRA